MNGKKAFQIKVFIWYLLTEPFRLFKSILKLTRPKIKRLIRYDTWVGVYLFFVLVFIITDNNKMKWVFIAILVILIIKREWEKGDYIHRWRERYKKVSAKKYGKYTPSDEELITKYSKEEE